MHREVPACLYGDVLGDVLADGEAQASVFPCLAVVTVEWTPGEATSPKAMPQHLPCPLNPIPRPLSLDPQTLLSLGPVSQSIPPQRTLQEAEA